MSEPMQHDSRESKKKFEVHMTDCRLCDTGKMLDCPVGTALMDEIRQALEFESCVACINGMQHGPVEWANHPLAGTGRVYEIVVQRT